MFTDCTGSVASVMFLRVTYQANQTFDNYDTSGVYLSAVAEEDVSSLTVGQAASVVLASLMLLWR